MGGVSKSESESQQTGSSQSFVDPSQVPFLNAARSQALQLQQQQQQSIGGVADQLSGRLGGIGSELLGGLVGQAQSPGAGTSISDLLGITGSGIGQQLQQLAGGGGQLAGQDALQALSRGEGGPDLSALLQPGQAVQGQLGALDEAIQRNLQGTLGSLSGQATLAGQVGGSRQGLLSGQAAGEAQRSFASGASNILSGDLAQRRQLGAQLAGQQQQTQLQAAGQLGQQGLAQQGQQADILSRLLNTQLAGAQAAGQLGLQGQAQQIGASQAGLGALGGLFNLGLGGFSAAFQPLQSLASILGPSTVLSTSERQGTSSSQSFSASGG